MATASSPATANLIAAEKNLRDALAAMQTAIRASRKEIIAAGVAEGDDRDTASDLAPYTLSPDLVSGIREEARAAVKTAETAPQQIADRIAWLDAVDAEEDAA